MCGTNIQMTRSQKHRWFPAMGMASSQSSRNAAGLVWDLQKHYTPCAQSDQCVMPKEEFQYLTPQLELTVFLTSSTTLYQRRTLYHKVSIQVVKAILQYPYLLCRPSNKILLLLATASIFAPQSIAHAISNSISISFCVLFIV
jgi:hypothetical protein